MLRDKMRWRPAPYRLVARGFGVLLSVGLLVLSGWAWLTYRHIDSSVHRGKIAVGVNPNGVGSPAFHGHDQNLLLVGIDDRSQMTDAKIRELKVGKDGGSMNTDTMMIVHIPADGTKATLIALPRDSLVKIPGYGMNKLNSAYLDGFSNAPGSYDQKRTAGASLLIKTVSDLTGLTINHYAQVNFMGFYDIANALGGIPVNLCNNVDDTVAHNRSIGIDGGSGFKMSKGRHLLNALQSLEFVRQRHNLPHEDLDRERRQQYFLTEAFRKVASVGILFELNDIGAAVSRNLFVDQDLHLADLARQMENLRANNIIGKTIPFERFWHDSPAGDVEVVDPAHVQAAIQRWLHPSAPAPRPSPPAVPSSGSSGNASQSSTSTAPNAVDSKCID